MRVKIETDEKFPVYSFSNNYGTEVEIDEELYQRAIRVIEEYAQVQAEIGYIFNTALEEPDQKLSRDEILAYVKSQRGC